VYAGSIVDRIMDGIRRADFVIADLSLERPNVYLEVGFAWGLQRPVILIAREGQRLHFDLSHHKCLFYKTIGKLAEALEKTILELFRPEGVESGS
jgi:nucleoside 2-deoxyribosyltransferase